MLYMESDKGRLLLTREPSMPENTSAYWEVPGIEPSADTDVWSSRFQHLHQLQPYIEHMVNELAPPGEAELSSAFADLLDGMAILTNEDGTPTCLYCSLTFSCACFKTSASLAGRLPWRWD